jgi:hypothetical protein
MKIPNNSLGKRPNPLPFFFSFFFAITSPPF